MSGSVGHEKPKVIAVTNQKGGVGKTTTTVNLSAALAELGHRVLIVDLDPQGNASTGLGIEHDQRSVSTYDVLLHQQKMSNAYQATTVSNLSILPATTDLSSVDIDLAADQGRSQQLFEAIRQDSELSSLFDYILIDCPPSLNLLTVNALIAANSVLIPLQSEFFALEGLSQLLLSIREIRQTANQNLRIDGIVLTMFDARNNLSRQVEIDARENLGELVFETVIPRNVRVSEAPSFGQPVLQYDSSSRGSHAYRELAAELIAKK